MPDEALKIAVVGHVDHGKSTLIGRMIYDTGSLSIDKISEMDAVSQALGKDREFAYLLDHFQEERSLSMTIDTTQAFFATSKRLYTVIDAPGHAELLQNMMSGVWQADAAILIIDAQDGIKEQTKRHAYLLSLFGIGNCITVINKMDAVGYAEDIFNDIKEAAGKLLAGLALPADNFLPASALNGDNISSLSPNMPWYKGLPLLDALDALKKPVKQSNPHLVFSVQGAYNAARRLIYFGRTESGRLRAGREIVIYPARKKARIRSIERYSRQSPISCPGEAVGITLDTQEVKRGDILCDPEYSPVLTQSFKAEVFWLDEEALQVNENLTLKCGTQECKCNVTGIHKRINSSDMSAAGSDSALLECRQIGEVTVKTERPLAISQLKDIPALGRFVLYRASTACASGIISSI